MKFKTVAEAFNFYKNCTNEQLEKRADEIDNMIENDQDADIKALNIELTGIAEAKRNNDQKAEQPEQRSGFSFLGGRDSAPKSFSPETVLASNEYRSAFLKTLLGRKLTDDERAAWDVATAERRNDAYSTVSEVVGAVPTQTLNEIIVKARKIGGLLPKCRAFAMPSKITIPVATPGANAGWNTEGAAVESGEPSVAYVSFGNNEIIKVLSISASVKRMTISAFESYLVDELTAAVMGTIAQGIVDGDNSTYPVKGLASITWGAANSVTFTGDTNTTLAYSDLVAAIGLLKRGYAQGAVFAMNNKTLYSQVYDLCDGNDRPIFLQDLQTDKVGKLLGFEVVIDDNIADDVIFFGNFNYLGYNLVDGISVEASTQSSFKSGRIDYRGMAIADIQVLVAEAFVKLYKASA